MLKTNIRTVIVAEYLHSFSIRLSNSDLCSEILRNFTNNAYKFNYLLKFCVCIVSVVLEWASTIPGVGGMILAGKAHVPQGNCPSVTFAITISRRLPWEWSKVSALRDRQVGAKLFRPVLQLPWSYRSLESTGRVFLHTSFSYIRKEFAVL